MLGERFMPKELLMELALVLPACVGGWVGNNYPYPGGMPYLDPPHASTYCLRFRMVAVTAWGGEGKARWTQDIRQGSR